MVNFDPLTAEIGSEVWGPQQISTRCAYGFVTAPTSLNGGQPHFARCLTVSWAGTLYIPGTLPGILPCPKFILRRSFAFSYIGSVSARHLSSGRQPSVAAWYKKWNCGTFAFRHFQQRAPHILLEMWVNAQRDGRPAKRRWRPLFNAAKFG